jgi:hypothetical protein
LLHGAKRLDLHDCKDFGIRAVKGIRIEAEATRSVVGGNTAIPVWRIAEVSKRRRDFGRRVQSGQHDTGRTEVEHSAESNPLCRFDSDDGWHPVRAGRKDGRTNVLLAAGTVLEVEQYPVDAACRTYLRGDRRGRSDDRAHSGLAGSEAAAQPATIQRRRDRPSNLGSRVHPNHRWEARPAS